MIQITVNDLEKERLKNYADYSLYESKHWGNGKLFIHEENILYSKLNSPENKIHLSSGELKILINWFLEGTGNGTILLSEDIMILQKLINVLKERFKLTPSDRSIKSSLSFLREILEKNKI